jgi:hypothetical protein
VYKLGPAGKKDGEREPKSRNPYDKVLSIKIRSPAAMVLKKKSRTVPLSKRMHAQ